MNQDQGTHYIDENQREYAKLVCENLVTTPHGSRVGGFWNDSAVSSHGKRSVHAHERDKAQSNSCIAWHTEQWYVNAFTVGNDLPTNAQTLFFCQCAREQAYYSTRVQKVQIISPPTGGASDIPVAEARGLTTRFGKYRFKERQTPS